MTLLLIDFYEMLSVGFQHARGFIAEVVRYHSCLAWCAVLLQFLNIFET